LVSSEEPGWNRDLGKLLLEVLLKVRPRCTLLLLQASLESHGIHCTDCHALTIDRVESTDRVSGNDETRRPSMHPFKMTQMVLWGKLQALHEPTSIIIT
jgi:hypothetical protein